MRRVLIILFILLTCVIVLFVANPLNRVALAEGIGFIDSGSKFGIRIGDSRNSAIKRLEDIGLRQLGNIVENSCLGYSYTPSKKLDIFLDNSWRRGTICLSSDKNTIESIRWHYNWLQP